MSFWKITADNKAEKVAATKLKNEQLLEKHLEDWVADKPEIPGESLLIIGRQIIIPEVKDRLDLLALDPNGNAVIIELKRGKISDPIDMQALRYASYISKWKFEDFENQAKAYLSNGGDFNFNEEFENFCIQSGMDEIPDINHNQRIIIAGSEVKDKLGSVALWLYERNIDIKVIEINSYKESDALLIQPRTIIPLAVNKFSEVGKANKGDISKPWLASGKSWHLEKRMKPKTKDIFLQLDSIIKDNLTVEGPNFDQKFYISYLHGNYIWLSVRTHANVLALQFTVKANSMDKSQIAKQLNIEEFDSDDSLSEKLNLPTSIDIKNRNETSDRILLRIKDDFDLTKPAFLNFLRETIKNSTKS
ncbi:MAG: hypothetical protein ICV51_17725 [Flavisolibacter sp.]|nr:hypothetical protein [Flavisolibacter sp.]